MTTRHCLLMTEGKERGKTWNITREYWSSTGSHPDLGSIPNCAQTHHQTAQMRKFLEATHSRVCYLSSLLTSAESIQVRKNLFRVHQLRLWCHCRFSLITVEQERPSSKPADVLGICPSNLSSMSLQGWMKHSKDVLYFFLIRFEAGQSKTLHACKLLLALGSFHCSVCIAPCHTAAAASTWMTQEAAK